MVKRQGRSCRGKILLVEAPFSYVKNVTVIIKFLRRRAKFKVPTFLEGLSAEIFFLCTSGPGAFGNSEKSGDRKGEECGKGTDICADAGTAQKSG